MAKIKLKIVTITLIAIIMNLFMQSSTLAYYSVIGRATNVVTTGNIQFKIHEKTDQGTDFPREGVYIMPGDVVSKQVSIESICEHPFYLRVKLINGVSNMELSADDCFKLNISEENWKLVDGWYYYRKVVQPYETTPLVFSHVEVVGNVMDNSYLGETLVISVVAQAVQSEHNPLVDNDTSTADGWPTDMEGIA